jgi:hypothetical protein
MDHQLVAAPVWTIRMYCAVCDGKVTVMTDCVPVPIATGFPQFAPSLET